MMEGIPRVSERGAFYESQLKICISHPFNSISGMFETVHSDCGPEIGNSFIVESGLRNFIVHGIISVKLHDHNTGLTLSKV